MQSALTWPHLQSDVHNGGHAGGPYRARVHVNPQAFEAYASLAAGSELPVGSILVQFHLDASDRRGPAFVMQKQASLHWSFSVLDSGGRVIRDGELRDCARCHAEGVADFLFGPPHSSARPP